MTNLGILSFRSFSLILLSINLSLFEAMFLPILYLLVSVVKNVGFLLLKFWLKFSDSQSALDGCHCISYVGAVHVYTGKFFQVLLC